MLTGFTLPKLLWVRDHEPANYERVRKMLLPKDYVRFRLTGEFATEVSDASGTALFDVVNRRWSFELADALGIDGAVLPAVLRIERCDGRASRAKLRKLTGLAEGTPVVGGGGDQAASAVGNGIVTPGMVSCTLGTSGVVFAHMEEVAYDPAGPRPHVLPRGARQMARHGRDAGRGAQPAVVPQSTRAGRRSYDALMAEAATAPAGSQGLYWLPYLMGERTPHLDATARGGWIGLTASTRAPT